MKRSTWSTMCLVAMLCIGLAAPLVMADGGKHRNKHRDKHEDEDKRLSVQAAFGRGLNTAPGNPVNHVILPNQIKVNQGGVVNFIMSGFHQVVVYKPGRNLKRLSSPEASYDSHVYRLLSSRRTAILGILPAGPWTRNVTTTP